MAFLGGAHTGVGVLPVVGGVGAGLLLGEDEAVLWILAWIEEDWTEDVSTVVFEEVVVVIPEEEVVEVLELMAAAAAAAAARWAIREARGSCVSFCSQLVWCRMRSRSANISSQNSQGSITGASRRMAGPSSLKDTLFLRPAFLGRAPVLRALPLLLVLLEALESLEDLLMGVLLLEEDDDDDDEEFVTVRGDAGGRRELLRDLGESESSESLLSDELSCARSGMERDLLKVGRCFLLNSEGGRSSSALASWKASHLSYCS